MTTTVSRPTDTSVAAPAVVTAGLFVASLLAGLFAAGAVYTSPFTDEANIAAFYAGHPTLVFWVGSSSSARGSR